ncbi:GntR family transcriptional regulator [Azospirillum halopraeferens]|uniref:GntR family transcriptional regulator n=1 Tax=Azospirillum halopraeferens TaxID=34010 RepID=UPI000408C845|nr:GntR family transcriptional regulator [Azospirillum halopraeferens]
MDSNVERGAGGAAAVKRRGPSRTTAGTGRRGTSAAATIYRDLRDAIVGVRRKPGEPIIEKQIAEAYGVSRTPVREAVLKLADEGLVEIFPQSGTFVARIPLAGLPEAIIIRRVLEEATVRFAAERATRSRVAALRANLELQREMEAAGDLEGFHDADEAFHALLAEASGYPGFWTVTQQVKMHVDRYRKLTLPVSGRVGQVIAEHEAIVAAIAGRDPDGAVRALVDHLDGLRLRIDDARRDNPEFYVD